MCNPMGFYSDRKFYPAAAHAQSGVRLSVNKKVLKCILNAALAASKEHVDKENRIYFTSIMPQDDQYGSIPCRSNRSIYTAL